MPAKKHNFTLAEIKAGLLVVVSVTILVLFIAVVQGVRPPEETKTFYVTFAATAGLNKGADVRFGGSKVGRVTAIDIDPEDRSKMRVEAEVSADTPVNEESKAGITAVTLMSEKHLEITTGSAEAALLKSGDAIESTVLDMFVMAGEMMGEGGDLIGQVKDFLGVSGAKEKEAEGDGRLVPLTDILEDVAELIGVDDAKEKEAKGEGELVRLTNIFDTANATLTDGREAVGEVTNVITDSKDDIQAILDKVQGVEDEATKLVESLNQMLDENQENIKGTVEGVRGVIDDIQPAIESLSAQLDEIAGSLEGTLANAETMSADAQDLLGDSRPAIEDIILDLRETVRNLKTFSRTMAEQPQAVIRGKTPEGRKP